ncbi:MAG: hypothetical protein DRQ39_11535 [Gammaproteobacteria bacterium]|nr:MAG: hypothetical protein DRQ39_11535 [Gammaproteobacteria bacterium]
MSIEEKDLRIEVLPAKEEGITMKILHLPTGLVISGNSTGEQSELKAQLLVELDKRIPFLPRVRKAQKVDDWSL